jgi:hypothetical protein
MIWPQQVYKGKLNKCLLKITKDNRWQTLSDGECSHGLGKLGIITWHGWTPKITVLIWSMLQLRQSKMYMLAKTMYIYIKSGDYIFSISLSQYYYIQLTSTTTFSSLLPLHSAHFCHYIQLTSATTSSSLFLNMFLHRCRQHNPITFADWAFLVVLYIIMESV